MTSDAAVSSRHLGRRRGLLRPLVAAGGLAVLFFLVASVGVIAWLIYQPTTVDTLIYRSFERAEVGDPSRAEIYRQVYRQLVSHTRYNELHYAVHEIAGQVAWLTGHGNAAIVQWRRASYHRPRSDQSLSNRAWHALGLVIERWTSTVGRR